MMGRLVQLRQIGLKNTLICYGKKLLFRYLAYRFGFKKWHSSAPFECRPYKQEVVDLANSIGPNCVLEVGCGLGEIVTRVNSQSRYGMDADTKVIDAARYLYRASCKFSAVSLDDSNEITQSVREKVDLVILVNWIHGVHWLDLKRQILELRESLGVSFILMDGINEGVPGYRFHHGEKQFSDVGNLLKKVPSSDGIRTLYLLSLF